MEPLIRNQDLDLPESLGPGRVANKKLHNKKRLGVERAKGENPKTSNHLATCLHFFNTFDLIF